jgi:hypothetical protein
MSGQKPHEVSPLLTAHVKWVQSQLKIYRETCQVAVPGSCCLYDATDYQGQFDPVCLQCKTCDVSYIVFKNRSED